MVERLHENWTPEQIAGWLKSGAERLRVLSHEAIYAWIYGRERPEVVNDRAEGGHWEADLLICKKTRPVLVLHERKSRFTIAAKLSGKTAPGAR